MLYSMLIKNIEDMIDVTYAPFSIFLWVFFWFYILFSYFVE